MEQESSPEEKKESPRINWNLWFQWVFASTIGWVIGWFFVGEPMVGLVLGIAQWLVIRPYGDRLGWWLVATAVGWVAGWGLILAGWITPPNAGLIGAVLSGAFIGTVLGLVQWLVLNRLVYLAAWWILASAVAWSIALSGFFDMTGVLVGAVVGVVTGFVLDILLRYPKGEEEA